MPKIYPEEIDRGYADVMQKQALELAGSAASARDWIKQKVTDVKDIYHGAQIAGGALKDIGHSGNPQAALQPYVHGAVDDGISYAKDRLSNMGGDFLKNNWGKLLLGGGTLLGGGYLLKNMFSQNNASQGATNPVQSGAGMMPHRQFAFDKETTPGLTG